MDPRSPVPFDGHHPIIGYHRARRDACPTRFFLSCAIAVMTLGLIGAVALVPAGLARQAAFSHAQERV